MKKSFIILLISSVLAISACKGTKNTPAGDSTGTGAAGARTPGFESADTTKHDSTNTSPKKAIYEDSSKTKKDTAK